jgi:hypothetical protein
VVGVVSRRRFLSLSQHGDSMSNLKTELEHIKHHIKYPANKTQVLAACNNMTDVPSIDKEFVTKSLTDNNYKGPEDVVRALLNKV